MIAKKKRVGMKDEKGSAYPVNNPYNYVGIFG